MRLKIFRWKAIGPLLLFFAVVAALVFLFAEPVAKSTTEEVSTELLGTQVDVGALDLIPREASVDLRALQVADPFNLGRNLIEADEIRLKLNPEALSEKKLVVEHFALRGMRFGTARKTPARPVEGDGFAPQVLRAVRQWAGQFDVPLLKLTPIDTIRQLVLNPTQLTTVRQAQSLASRTDSTRQALEQSFTRLDVRPTVDSARALADRLSKSNVRTLGLDRTRQAIESGRRTLREVEQAKMRVEGLEREVRGGVETLGSGLKALDQARRQDYAFAKSLLQLPSFSAPDIGNAFFGKVSIDRFQQALYWAQLARHYMPPGLLPRENPGPDRLRASGSTMRFPKEKEWPSFLVQLGEIDFAFEGDNPLRGNYEASVRGLTSAPALYGRPMLVQARRSAAGSAIASIDVDAVIDHVSSRVRDSVAARLRGIQLPSFDLPGLPVRLAPGTGSSNLTFALTGDQLTGRWTVGSKQVSWALDTTGRALNEIERLVWRVVSGLDDLSVEATVRGALRSPKLSVASNLDRAIAQRLDAVIGEELAKAERMVRAKVDSIVAGKVEPVKRQVAQVQTEVNQRIAAERERLNQVEAQLQAELKRLTGGLAPEIKLPGINF
ncbi:MAG: TIGR03545 family protein [Gemmatimonadales bacterium]|nr:TIGR03545 family protein [Gemmatimonadales bacterium]